jgi:hypothetical protein
MATGVGHAVCVAGLKRRALVFTPAGPGLAFVDNSSTVESVYIHDDRLGPYALADLGEIKDSKGQARTTIKIEWVRPGQPSQIEESLLEAIVVPLPMKIRLTAARMRALGIPFAHALKALPSLSGSVALNYRYVAGTLYRGAAAGFGLTKDGLYTLACNVVLSRHIGLVEFSTPAGPLLDIVLDATETELNPSVLACVRRAEWPAGQEDLVSEYAEVFSAQAIL